MHANHSQIVKKKNCMCIDREANEAKKFTDGESD